MDPFDKFDWTKGTPAQHLSAARQGSDAQLRELARNYRWRMYPEKVLAWVMAQQCIDMTSAVTAFMNGDPGRFNYLSKREIPEKHRGVCQLLDNICTRLNTGFYRYNPDVKQALPERLAHWVTCQQADQRRGRCGRWVLQESIIAPLIGLHPDTALVVGTAERFGVDQARDLFSPLIPG